MKFVPYSGVPLLAPPHALFGCFRCRGCCLLKGGVREGGGWGGELRRWTFLCIACVTEIDRDREMGLPLDVRCDRYEVKPKRATIAGHADGPVHIMQTGGQLEIDSFVRSIIQVEGGI